MLKPFAAGLLAVSFAPAVALAEDAPVAPASPYTLSSNVFLVSDYFFRGITQTWDKPAIQGGADFTYGGLYLGTWASNVSGNQYAGGSLEWDLYGGYNFKLSDDFSLGGGLLYYLYPGANYSKAAAGGPDQQYNTLELNGSVAWKWLSGKLSYSLTDYFGANTKTGFQGDTKGTLYPELNANFPLTGQLTLVGHVGYTKYGEKLAAANASGKDDPSYYDWKLGVSYVWKDGWTFGAYYVDTSNKEFYKNTASAANTDVKDLAKATGYITVGRTF
jgi:uncharacterized protein (TIGR02001 family)